LNYRIGIHNETIEAYVVIDVRVISFTKASGVSGITAKECPDPNPKLILGLKCLIKEYRNIASVFAYASLLISRSATSMN
jgi:hypothetical protein